MRKRQPAQLSYPQPFWVEIIPRVVETYLLRTVRLETEGTEVNIPSEGPVFVAFAPHCGWIDSFVIDASFSRVGRTWPVWLTKKENATLPHILTADRTICIDRQNPEPGVVRTILAFLALPNAALASGIEGTRYGNPHDRADLRTLGAFKPGPTRFAIGARVPVLPVVVLGGERIVPHLDRIWHDEGTLHTLRVIRQLVAHPQRMTVRFLPLYLDHLQGGEALHGKRLREQAVLHTGRLREMLVGAIRALAPDYPLS